MVRLSRIAASAAIAIAALITGVHSTGAQQRFEKPTVSGVRVDWCLNWGAECGKPAADRFCRDRGFPAATRFEIERAAGPTRVLSSGQTCSDRRCDGFAFIECVPAQAPPTRAAGRITPPAAGGARDSRVFAAAPVLRTADLRFGTVVRATLLPGGAKLWWVAGDIQTTMDFAARGRSEMFYWNVADVPGASGVMWQINRSPFPPFRAGDPSVLEPPGLVASGRDGRISGTFTGGFADLPKPSASAGPSIKTPKPVPWYVRVLPVNGADPPIVVGQPSNFVRVFDKDLPPSAPTDVKLPPSTLRPAAKLALIRFEYKPHWEEIRWPPGCRTGPPPERSIFEKAWDAVTTVWNGVSEAYSKAKGAVVDVASTLTGGVIPREYLGVALTIALAAAGVPPDIPNIDQLMNEGADYLAATLAEQVVGPAADEIITGLAKQYNLDPNLGPEQLKQAVTAKMRDASKKAVLEGAAAARRPSGGDRVCEGRLHPAQITLTVRNVDPAGNRQTPVAIVNEPDIYEPKRLTVVSEPGETLTIPIPLLPKIPTTYNNDQMPSYDHQKNLALWWDWYRAKPARFVLKTSGGEKCWVIDDALVGCTPVSGGFAFTTPSWVMDKNFDEPRPRVDSALLIAGGQR